MATNFYKKGTNYYNASNGQKISDLKQLNALASAGGREVIAPSNGVIAKKATLYSPTGQPIVVPVGSEAATRLQSFGYNTDKNKAINYTTNISNNQANEDAEMQKKIDAYIASQPAEYQQILKIIAANNYKSNNKVISPTELEKQANDAITNATTDITPYYTNKTAQETEDLKNKMADIRNASARYGQQEKLSYAQTLDSTKQKLRAAGLTFSGVDRKQLGGEGALNSEGVEGIVPQQRRYNVEDSLASYQQNARDLGLTAERELGSANVNNLQNDFGTIMNPYGNGIEYDPNSQRNLYQANKQGSTNYIDNGNLDLQKKKDIYTSAYGRIATANK